MSRHPAPATISNEELACRAQGGCAESFEQLLRRFQTPVLQFLRHRGLGAEAEDLTQETFLRAYENLRRYSRRWTFAAWIFTIARRTSINHSRRARPAAAGAAIDAALSADAGPLEVLIAEEDRLRLWRLAARVLSQEQSSALWLFYVEQMPLREIARVLGRSWASVKVMLFRARRKLLPLVAQLDEENPPQRQAHAPVRGAGGRVPPRWRCLMSRPYDRELLLGRRLRQEARRGRPAFSETLHRRILSDIQRRRTEERLLGVPLFDGRQAAAHRGRRWLWAVAAAAGLLCAVAWQLSALSKGPVEPAEDVDQSPLAGVALVDELSAQAATGLSDLAASIELAPPAPLLSQARLTAEAIVERLPIDLDLAAD